MGILRFRQRLTSSPLPTPTRQSKLWTEKWFGGTRNSKSHAITDGRFAWQRVSMYIWRKHQYLENNILKLNIVFVLMGICAFAYHPEVSGRPGEGGCGLICQLYFVTPAPPHSLFSMPLSSQS